MTAIMILGVVRLVLQDESMAEYRRNESGTLDDSTPMTIQLIQRFSLDY
jgi:hypothetical protein